ncbi:MAG: glycoside hydrolase family 3 N-terminal domain-containing protein [Protaetiibacter sp.]
MPPDLDEPTRELLSELTAEEKTLLVQGRDAWYTNAIERFGIRSLTVTDGPHGVRLVSDIGDAGGGFDISDNAASTAFPTSVTVAASWDPELARRMGEAIAEECRAAGVDVLLGPGVNLQRSPLCGRNFEYYSEDPLLTAAFGTAFVRGVQSRGVGTSVKHFAANSNEEFRFVGDSLVDERALRELYLRAFERIVRDARPATVMCAYNRVNGVFASQHRELLTGILREEWGFDGLVMTDWGATSDRVAGIRAGCDLDMPGGVDHNRGSILAALASGRLDPAELDRAVARVLRLVERTRIPDGSAAPVDYPAHAALAAEIATRGAVLLANDGILPLAAGEPVLVVGELFDRMRFQGAGSSLITPTSLVTPRDAFAARGIAHRFERGYRVTPPGRTGRMDSRAAAELAAAAVAAVRPGEPVLFFGGLTDFQESEGFDRHDLALPAEQLAVLHGLLDAGARAILVLFAGAPVELPFAERLAAILHLGLPGQHGGDAVAALLTGEANPSGKLPQSWWHRAADAGSAPDFDRGIQARYHESIYLGYRFAESAGVPVRYPFGHGLSYTSYSYRDLAVAVEDGVVTVTATIDNTGPCDGVEVVQCYVGNNAGAVFKARQELRAFAAVAVPAGGSAPVRLSFPLADLAYWDVADHDWRLENGDYEVRLAASSADVRLTAPLRVDTGVPSRSPYPAEVDRDYASAPTRIPDSFPQLLGRAVVPEPATGRIELERRIIDARGTLLGRVVGALIAGRMRKLYRAALAMPAATAQESLERDAAVKNSYFLMRMMPFSSPRSLAQSSNGEFPYRLAVGLTLVAAGHPIRGVRVMRGAVPTVGE